MNAEIITIGDEILIGQIVDTNSAWISEQLNLVGIDVYQITSIHDSKSHILNALKEASAHVKLVIMTGGLGPTKDDITKNVLCEYFDTQLIFHEPSFRKMTERFEKMGIEMNKLNRDQSLVPANCSVIPNAKGTVSAMWFEKSGVIYISMPGVPFEMETIMEEEVIPRLKKLKRDNFIVHKTILTQGIPESILAEKIENWENALPANIRLAYLPAPTGVRLRLTAHGNNENELNRQIEEHIVELQKILKDSIFGYDNDTISTIIGKLLTERDARLAVAESCTGGNIAHLITLTPGASQWFKGSVTAYSNEIKKSVLGVRESTLAEHGAVSEETALEMAAGVQKVFGADYAIATTGIAGPDGGTPEKPVGTVWIGIAAPAEIFAQKFIFGNDREINIMRASQTALQLLRKALLIG